MNEEIELRHLRYFVAVAEELHFGRAAERLHLSQPPLSQQIRKLEQILGHPLFERTSRSVKLTAAGEVFLETAHRALRNVERGIEEGRSVAAGEVGSLHVGFIGSAMLTDFPTALSRYRQAHPKVRLHLHESFTSRVVEGLEDGSLDAGILRDSDGAKGLHVTKIFSEPFVAVVPVAHPYASKRSISPAVLKDEPFVYFPYSAGPRAHGKPLAIFEQYGFQPRIVQEGSHWITIMRLVGAGLGVSVAPACVRRVVTPDVVCLNLKNTNVVSDLELAYVKGETRAIVNRFARMVLPSDARRTKRVGSV